MFLNLKELLTSVSEMYCSDSKDSVVFVSETFVAGDFPSDEKIEIII